ncbi:hypothetical protein CC78DRAFT_602102 [Lojkania enalia]|uniref:Uncharacterized protein n=1 Tax=Lojkania enalia TaxID=147567 RepID=A0A9P4NB59_9PLEO|nr:hypothetical protein CC78DRAFT_602102 [Didymosphaeria enalia]
MRLVIYENVLVSDGVGGSKILYFLSLHKRTLAETSIINRTNVANTGMSTAIALQDMGNLESGQPQEAGVRQRSVSKNHASTSTTPQTEDQWLMTPQDTTSAALPLDSRSFAPKNTYWIVPHGMLTKEIKVLNLTQDIAMPFTGFTSAYKEAVKNAMKDHYITPSFIAHRNNWLGLKYTITNNQNEKIADWKHPWTSVGEAVLTFPEDSEYSSHTISLTNKRWGFRTEAFTVNSVPYFWEMDSLWHSQYMTLYKIYGSGEAQKKVEVGKYAQKWWGGIVTGGTLVVDEGELNGFVACMTLVVVLKKKRQRAAERNGGGGGGGGGGG